ncbi:hypothetical protein ILT44_04275 [Microvirga sp. BT689]|uniref:hypothetical protein n=1 Tax=Microvirga arvi TaxID=2778731 RepID=UPI0019517252|nr:hypothetical protein [Microvirga arvi]MBM6579391.1 hypothetical protein [Microvirga arvi]
MGIFGAAPSWDAIIGHDGFHAGSDVIGALAAAESRTRSSCDGRGVDSGTSVGAQSEATIVAPRTMIEACSLCLTQFAAAKPLWQVEL